MQSAGDIFTGWTHVDGGDVYVRQFRDMKVIPDPDTIAPRLREFAVASGTVLARAHARTGDAVAIAAYLGRGGRLRPGHGPLRGGLRRPEPARSCRVSPLLWTAGWRPPRAGDHGRARARDPQGSYRIEVAGAARRPVRRLRARGVRRCRLGVQQHDGQRADQERRPEGELEVKLALADAQAEADDERQNMPENGAVEHVVEAVPAEQRAEHQR